MKRVSIFATFALLLLLLSVSSERRLSATFDEVNHVPAGYSYLTLGDFRANPEHPPLIKALAALPLLFLRPELNTTNAHWAGMGSGFLGPRFSHDLLFCYEFLYKQKNDGDQLVFWARIPIILLSILLGCSVGWCAWEFYGWKAGCTALLLYLLLPDLIAHGQLVTTDLGVACFLFLSVYTFYRALLRLTWKNALLCCVVVGLAQVTKFSAVLVFPSLALLGLAFAFSKKVQLRLPWRPEKALELPRERILVVAGLLAATVVTSVVIIWACYGFRHRVSADPYVLMRIDWNHHWAQGGMLRGAVHKIQAAQLLPEAYTLGFLEVLEGLQHRPAFLLGKYSETGWWYYFLVTFLVKTPIPLLLLIGLGAVLTRRYGASCLSEAMLLLPVAVYLAISLSSTINIGNRHLLPIYPFLIVFASKVARVFDEPQQRFLKAALVLLLCWNVVETARFYPHYLTYFNQIAGGAESGYKWLSDSNLDWGQGLKELTKYRQLHPDEPFYFSYFGNASLAAYGIKARLLPGINLDVVTERDKVARWDEVKSGATVAVSATMLQCALMNDKLAPGIESFMQRLRSLKPEARVGNSIFVYRIP